MTTSIYVMGDRSTEVSHPVIMGVGSTDYFLR